MTDPKTISFFVSGIPRTAGSKSYMGKNKRGKAIIVDSSGAAGAAWKQTVAAVARSKYTGKLLEGAIALHVIFWMKRPDSHFNAKGKLKPSAPLYPTSNPDRTKMLRSLEDALTGILWKNDSQVVSGPTDKRYALALGPGASVSVCCVRQPTGRDAEVS